MRALSLVVLLAAVPAPRLAAAQGADVIELEVGERKPLPGFRPLCDDPAVASLLAGVLEGLKEGETTCSISTISPVGPRQVYRIVVRPAPSGAPGGDKRPGGKPRGSEG